MIPSALVLAFVLSTLTLAFLSVFVFVVVTTSSSECRNDSIAFRRQLACSQNSGFRVWAVFLNLFHSGD